MSITKTAPKRVSARRRSGLILIILVTLLVIVLLGYALAYIHPARQYLMASHDIALGAVLTANDVETKDADPSSVPSGAILAQNLNSIVGEVVTGAFTQFDYITDRHLGPTSGRIAGAVPPNMRLKKIPLQGIVMPDGLQAGDRIDMVVTIQAGGNYWTQDVIQGLIIQEMAPDGSSITVMVPVDIALLIIDAEKSGSIEILAAPANESPASLPPNTIFAPCQVFLNGTNPPTQLSSVSCTSSGGQGPTGSPTPPSTTQP